jgi:hypothetical protein
MTQEQIETTTFTITLAILAASVLLLAIVEG